MTPPLLFVNPVDQFRVFIRNVVQPGSLCDRHAGHLEEFNEVQALVVGDEPVNSFAARSGSFSGLWHEQILLRFSHPLCLLIITNF